VSFPLFRILVVLHYSEGLTGAGPMQAPGLFDITDKRGKFGLVHNIGLGGAVVISLLRRPEFYKAGGVDGKRR
jgi:sterol carrier protein 2